MMMCHETIVLFVCFFAFQVMAETKTRLQSLKIIHIASAVVLFLVSLLNESFFGFESTQFLRTMYSIGALVLTPLSTMNKGINQTFRTLPFLLGASSFTSILFALLVFSNMDGFLDIVTLIAHLLSAGICALICFQIYRHIQASDSISRKK